MTILNDDAYKLLTCHILGTAHNVPADLRNYYANRFLSLPVHTMVRNLYPRFMALHDLTDDTALPDAGADGSLRGLQLPSLMRDTYTAMRMDGVYLIGEGGRNEPSLMTFLLI